MRDKLITYNREDCEALRKVTEFLEAACSEPSGQEGTPAAGASPDVARVEWMRPPSSRRDWCKIDFAVPDFAFANDRAYFDYQRNRVYLRSSPTIKKSRAQARRDQGKKRLRAGLAVKLECQACPLCQGTELTRTEDGRLARFCYDLRISRGGVRRRVTHCRTSWHSCAGCGKRFLPPDYLRLEEHGHALKSWAMYKHVAHRASFTAIGEEIKEIFGLPVPMPVVHSFKGSLASHYQPTYRSLLTKIVAGSLVHADETEVHLKGIGKGYVWVFTNLEEVVFLYRESREGGFLAELLKGFQGVLVSDFYAAYDSLPCSQQKCLVHLMRDINSDIQASPWNEELKALALAFGQLLRNSTVRVHFREYDCFGAGPGLGRGGGNAPVF